MIETGDIHNGHEIVPIPANPVRDYRKREGREPKKRHYVQTAPKPEARPIWCEAPRLSVTEAAVRDYRAACRRIFG